MKLSAEDLEVIRCVKRNLAESELSGRWGWNVHTFKLYYGSDIKSLLNLIERITNG